MHANELESFFSVLIKAIKGFFFFAVKRNFNAQKKSKVEAGGRGLFAQSVWEEALCGGGQRSQMKQIKGEPWPPGETLASSRDGIQMGNHEGIMQGFWDLYFPKQ